MATRRSKRQKTEAAPAPAPVLASAPTPAPAAAATRAAAAAAASQSDKRGWIVHKFGGTSVKGSERYIEVAKLLTALPDRAANLRQGVVVSAMGGITNALIRLTELARDQDLSFNVALEDITATHLRCISELFATFKEPAPPALESVIAAGAEEIRALLRAIMLGRNCPESLVELVSGYGELWSAQILHAYLQRLHQGVLGVTWVDARRVLVVEHNEYGLAPRVDWEISTARLQPFLERNDVVVITGFIASTAKGAPTTLKRNGSDYSGSIFGALLHAGSIVIWTDVDGVFSADPRYVKDATMLPAMTYDEACELAYFGAKVIHPHTMGPAVMHKIPIFIRNTFNPECKGTKIHDLDSLAAAYPSDLPVKGCSVMEKMSLINLEGTGLTGVPGVCARLFSSLKEISVNVLMISQASSEHSVCFAVSEAQSEQTLACVRNTFFRELQVGEIQHVEARVGVSVLAVVGEGMKRTKGVAGRLFSALAAASVNVVAIAQGSSERNISVVVDASDASKALRAAHSAFFPTAPRPARIGIALAEKNDELKLLKCLLAQLATHTHKPFELVGVMVDRASHIFDPPLKAEHVKAILTALGEEHTPSVFWEGSKELRATLDEFVTSLFPDQNLQAPPGQVILVDAASADSSISLAATLMTKFPGLTIATSAPGTLAGAPQSLLSSPRLLCSAAVAAPLPLLPTLQMLTACNDPIEEILIAAFTLAEVRRSVSAVCYFLSLPQATVPPAPSPNSGGSDSYWIARLTVSPPSATLTWTSSAARKALPPMLADALRTTAADRTVAFLKSANRFKEPLLMCTSMVDNQTLAAALMADVFLAMSKLS